MFFTVNYFRNIVDVVTLDTETLLFVEAQAKSILPTMRTVPSWVTDKLDEVSHELNRRERSDKARKLTLLKSRREALKPVDVKRKEIDDEIATLEKELA